MRLTLYYHGLTTMLILATTVSGCGRRIGMVSPTTNCSPQVELAESVTDQRKALQICQDILSTENAHGVSPTPQLLLRIASLFATVGEPDSSLFYTKEALRGVNATSQDSVEALLLMGDSFDRLGIIDSSVAKYRAALKVAETADDLRGQALALNNIGATFLVVDRPDSAIVYQRSAFDLAHRAKDDHAKAAALHGIGWSFAIRADPNYMQAVSDSMESYRDSAVHYYCAALALRRKIENQKGTASTLHQLGLLWATTGTPDSALKYYRESLDIDQVRGDSSAVALTLTNIGAAFYSIPLPDSALRYYEMSLAPLRTTKDRLGESAALGNLAVLHLVHRKDARTASAYADSAEAVASSITRTAGTDANRLSLSERTRGLYLLWAHALLQQVGEPGFDSTRAAFAGLAALERGRAQALLQLVRAAPAPHSPGADLVSEGQKLAASVRRTGASAALSYMITSRLLVVWVILPSGKIHVHSAPVTRVRLDSLVTSMRTAIAPEQSCDPVTQDEPSTVSTALNELASLLLPEEILSLLPTSGEILVIPHEVLNQVPFAALPIDSAGLPFGIRFALRYTPSLAILEAVESLQRPNFRDDGLSDPNDALIVGNPTMPLVEVCGIQIRPSQLEKAAASAQEIADWLQVQPLIGEKATESEVRVRMPSALVIYLATHGYVLETDAEVRESFLALAPDQHNLGSKGDGRLTVGEILDEIAQLRAEIVVLSACQTGLGDLKYAEGTVGLQRAVLAKGARSVLVSLWSVDEAATHLLMNAFFKHWLGSNDISKAEALRRAQEEIRAIPTYSNPRYWAAFQIAGAR
jgi:CHAT domain-containing protein/tetratricopeptide (TPR) repeat protein